MPPNCNPAIGKLAWQKSSSTDFASYDDRQRECDALVPGQTTAAVAKRSFHVSTVVRSGEQRRVYEQAADRHLSNLLGTAVCARCTARRSRLEGGSTKRRRDHRCRQAQDSDLLRDPRSRAAAGGSGREQHQKEEQEKGQRQGQEEG